MTLVKICGLKTPEAIDAAVQAGATFLGFVFFEKSPRNVTPEEAATLVERVPGHVKTVGLFVDPSDEEISRVLKIAKLDIIQLHGSETPQRNAEIKSRYNLPIIKAVKISAPEDLITLGPAQAVADWVLFDAKAHEKSELPGGNGIVFDWQLLKGLKVTKPWMLSGGLHAENIKIALDALSPDAVDVSSGVEDLPGFKNPAKIREFIELVKSQ
ncbi:MAG: phosphoribosylanthranilate isomerase [Micavibrio aeruginosavorus]|uniref:N-(5'-phosphoribosyl)anthranilate isomerase n=1 Tax=Micavibrio aeruginosavorus TaxID=349221 RepID=A0A2W5HV00_9BACT|nr:MAG: phosphoribosylanthranilate isomerase [Micavibrio aeruginosavorus]